MSHHHHHDHEKADLWTNLNTFGITLAAFISNGYWIAGVVDDIFKLENSGVLPVSWWGLGSGVILSGLITAGATYSHRTLNTSYQSSNNHAYNTLGNHDEEKYSETLEDIKESNKTPLLDDNFNDETPSSGNVDTKPKLSFPQKLALAGDWLDHTGDIAAPLTFILILASHKKLDRWICLLVQSGIFVYASICSIADVRTCRRSILHKNAKTLGLTHQTEENNENQKADWITNFNTVGKTISELISNTYWFAQIIDTAVNLQPEKVIGISWWGLGFGAALSIFITSGSGYARWVVNKNQQTEKNIDAISNAPLKPWQVVALIGDFIDFSGDIAAPLTFILQLLNRDKRHLPRWGNLLAQGGIFTFAALASVADNRTSRINIQKHNTFTN